MPNIKKDDKKDSPYEFEAVPYMRVSDPKQGANGNGVAAQRAQGMTFLEKKNVRILKEFIDVASGSLTGDQRPELQKALAFCQKTGATLVVARLDRLARNVGFVDRIMKSKIKFICADMPEANEMTLHIIAAVGQYELKRLRENTKRGLEIAKSRGVKLGSPKISEIAGDGRAKNAINAQLIAEEIYMHIEKIRSFGVTTLRGIAEELSARGIWTANVQRKLQKDETQVPFGKPAWHPQQVKQIIERIEKGRKK